MRSTLITEPASHGDVLIAEWSDQIEDQGNIFTFYRGTHTRVAPPWKAGPASTASSGGPLSQSFSDSIVDSIERLFATKLSVIKGIERIFIRKDNDFFRVWVVIPDIDLALEDQIYSAELAFMDQFPDIPFDFAVVFRQGKDLNSVQPSQARRLYPSL